MLSTIIPRSCRYINRYFYEFTNWVTLPLKPEIRPINLLDPEGNRGAIGEFDGYGLGVAIGTCNYTLKILERARRRRAGRSGRWFSRRGQWLAQHYFGFFANKALPILPFQQLAFHA